MLILGGLIYVRHMWGQAERLKAEIAASEAQTVQWAMALATLNRAVVPLRQRVGRLQRVADSTGREADSALARYQLALAGVEPGTPPPDSLGPLAVVALTSCTLARRDCARVGFTKDSLIANRDSALAVSDSARASQLTTIDLLKQKACPRFLFLPRPELALGVGVYAGYGVTAAPTGPVAGPQVGAGATLAAVIPFGRC